MTKFIILSVILTAIFFSNVAVANEDSDYFCNMKDIKNEKCKKGDVANIPLKQAIKQCNFSYPVTIFSAKKGKKKVFCYYRGAQRTKRK